MVKVLLILLITLKSFAIFTTYDKFVLTWDPASVKIYVSSASCSNIKLTPYQILDYVRIGADKFWNRVPTSDLEIIADSVIDVDADYQTGNVCNTSVGSCIPAFNDGVLITCNSTFANFGSTGVLATTLINNTDGGRIKGAVISINDISSTRFATLTESEVISVLAHEIGHAIGLGHATTEDSLMNARSFENRNRLGQDDFDGVTALYPKDQTPGNMCGTIEDVSKKGPPSGPTRTLVTLFLLLNMGIFAAKKRKAIFV